uniref:Uncharacterized protein n=1 Tax=Anguilla anguilla TaxID=7936 RepID=A0A0E9R1F6_ANGAN
MSYGILLMNTLFLWTPFLSPVPVMLVLGVKAETDWISCCQMIFFQLGLLVWGLPQVQFSRHSRFLAAVHFSTSVIGVVSSCSSDSSLISSSMIVSLRT